MAMNGLETLADALERGASEIHVEEGVRREALRSVQRMVDFAARNRVRVHGTGNA